MEDESSKAPRRGSARERHQRRRERQQHVARPVAARGTARQIRPIGGFKIPRIKLPQNRSMIYAIAGGVFLIGVIVVLGLLRNREPEIDPNALWVGNEWTYETRSNEEVLNFAQQLKQLRIGTVYAWVSWLKPDRTWAGDGVRSDEFSEVQDQVREFVRQFKLVYPEASLYGWVSVPTNQPKLGIEARLGDAQVQQEIVDFSQTVVHELGFDGVFLAVDQVWEIEQEDFLEVLRKLRAALGAETPLAVAVPPDWSPEDVGVPVPPSIKPGTVWSKEYKQSVAILVDQMVVMAYNSGLSSAEDYAAWMAYQVEAFATAVGELDTGTQLLIGVPTHEADALHDPVVENIPSAIDGTRRGLAQAGDFARFVEGLAIYAYWATDDTEWQQFKSEWVDRS